MGVQVAETALDQPSTGRVGTVAPGDEPRHRRLQLNMRIRRLLISGFVLFPSGHEVQRERSHENRTSVRVLGSA